jgi:hypothetical protein
VSVSVAIIDTVPCTPIHLIARVEKMNGLPRRATAVSCAWRDGACYKLRRPKALQKTVVGWRLPPATGKLSPDRQPMSTMVKNDAPRAVSVRCRDPGRNTHDTKMAGGDTPPIQTNHSVPAGLNAFASVGHNHTEILKCDLISLLAGPSSLRLHLRA